MQCHFSYHFIHITDPNVDLTIALLQPHINMLFDLRWLLYIASVSISPYLSLFLLL